MALLRAVGESLTSAGGVAATVRLLGLDGPAEFPRRYAVASRRSTGGDRRLRGTVVDPLLGHWVLRRRQ